MAGIVDVSVSLLKIKFDKPRGGSGVRQVDLIVAEIRDSEGVEGLGFSYVIGGGGELIAKTAENLATRFLIDHPLIHPQAHWQAIEASFNRTGGGPNLVALAALDLAVWDLYAHRLGVPLSQALGGDGGAIPVYGSASFSPSASPQEAADIARAHRDRGFRGVKPRVNARPEDAAVIAAVSDAVGDRLSIMVDANEKGDLASARRLLSTAADYRVLFVEEPLPGPDLMAYRTLAQQSGVPIAAGEHWQGLNQITFMMVDGIVSVIQPDLAMIGGLTPCLAVTKTATALGVTVAPHFLPGLFVHLAGVTTGGIWIEDFPLFEDAFEGWPEMTSDGFMSAREVPGHGLTLADAARHAYA